MILTINSKIIMPKPNTWADGVIFPPGPDPYNPLGLPPNTVRVRTSDGNVPTGSSLNPYFDSATLVSGTSDVYDVYKSGTDFTYMLAGCANVVEVLGANTTGITKMKYMFANCTSITTVPLFDTSSVTNMDTMFADCSSLTTVPLFDTSKVTTMRGMLQATNILSVPLFDTSRVTDMTLMFDACQHLTSVPLFDTSKVTSMAAMFDSCYALTSVPLFDTSSVTYMEEMFQACRSLITVPLLNTVRVTNMDNMFDSCWKVESGALALYQQASSQANPPSSHKYTFKKCGRDTTTGSAELAQIPTSWGGTLS